MGTQRLGRTRKNCNLLSRLRKMKSYLEAKSEYYTIEGYSGIARSFDNDRIAIEKAIEIISNTKEE